MALTAALFATCTPTRYTPPIEGPTATVNVASTCTRRAEFYARINGLRTESVGCNQTASWQVAPGHIVLIIRVEESRFVIDPLQIEFDIRADQCADFLLRQGEGYDLEVFGVGACRQ